MRLKSIRTSPTYAAIATLEVFRVINESKIHKTVMVLKAITENSTFCPYQIS